VREADLVLFCVKTTDNAATARELPPFLMPSAIVISLQNDVDNVDQIRAGASIEALPTAVDVAALVQVPGCVKHVGRGDRVIGLECEKTIEVAGIFESAGIRCRISNDIAGDLWPKLLRNCALNAVSALGQARYA